MITLSHALAARPYPGRGIVLGRLTSGEPFAAYFLTGRSTASRARRLDLRQGADVAVVDTSGGQHDELRHYIALAQRGSWLVAGNGDQVEPLAEALATGADPLAAWTQHTYEPDPPIFTPRIWAAWDSRDQKQPLLGYVRRSDRADGTPERVVWMSELTEPGAAVMMSTYSGSVTEVLTAKCPVDVAVSAASVEDALEELWDSLEPDLRVAALAFDPRDVPGSLQLRG